MNSKRIPVEWDDKLEIGIPLLDSHHKKIIQFINDFYQACLENTEAASRRVEGIICEAAIYTQQHFCIEEKLMLLFEFPGYFAHKKEHEVLSRKIFQQPGGNSKRGSLDAKRFINRIKKRMRSHIETHDKAMSDFFLKCIHNKKAEVPEQHSA